jgi:hypothetical protein
MKDWVIAFDVGLDSIDIEEGSEEHKEVKAAINQAGDYSIKSLFLTFNRKYTYSRSVTRPNTDTSII